MLSRFSIKPAFWAMVRSLRGVTTKATTADTHFSDPGVPKVAITKDRSTLVLYHPQEDVKYEDTIPVPRDDSRYTGHESLETLVKERLDELKCTEKSFDRPTPSNPWPMSDKELVPTIMHLANMFYTTKHIWFPNKAKALRRNKNPPQDRPMD